MQQAREAAAQEHAALAAKVAAAEEAAAEARQEAERLRQRRVQELEELQVRFAGLLQVGYAGVAVVAGCEITISRCPAARLGSIARWLCDVLLICTQTKDRTIAALTQELEELHAAVA